MRRPCPCWPAAATTGSSRSRKFSTTSRTGREVPMSQGPISWDRSWEENSTQQKFLWTLTENSFIVFSLGVTSTQLHRNLRSIWSHEIEKKTFYVSSDAPYLEGPALVKKAEQRGSAGFLRCRCQGVPSVTFTWHVQAAPGNQVYFSLFFIFET